MEPQKDENGNPIPNSPSNYEELKGKVDEHGIPLHPEERADYYREKFGNSTNEAQRLSSRLKDLETENEELKKPKFTQDELSKQIPGYDQLAPEQQKAIFESWNNTQRDMDSLKQTVAVLTDRQVFEDGFKALVKSAEFVHLKKRKEDFRTYAYSDQYRGIDDLTIIARNYIMEKKLYAEKSDTPPDGIKPSSPDRPGLDTNRGANKPSVNVGAYTAAEVAEMRQKDPKKYNRLAADGKLKIKEE